jgi:hypothetical protein
MQVIVYRLQSRTWRIPPVQAGIVPSALPARIAPTGVKPDCSCSVPSEGMPAHRFATDNEASQKNVLISFKCSVNTFHYKISVFE